jgi:D-serine deaminase-like pyridoxal phosphate-dependent protein
MKDYRYYRQALNGVALPTAFVDLDLLEANIRSILKASGSLPLRVASKSIRCAAILERIVKSSPRFCGVMSFSARESLFLASRGFTDILIGYPTVNSAEVTEIVRFNGDSNQKRVPIIPMVDSEQHVQLINQVAERMEYRQPICVDIDMSSRFPGIHFGVYRSPIQCLDDFNQFLKILKKYPSVELIGLMGYEAQIAGVGDANPSSKLKNSVVRFLKRRSIKDLSRRRQQIFHRALEHGHSIRIVNGGGTGSIKSTIQDPSVSELTVGSGFYSPGLFDHYRDFRYQPAAGFALEIVRRPSETMYTLSGGGYIASGSIGPEKQPVPYLPGGIQLIDNEGMGEVQTPFEYSGQDVLNLGDPVLFRHAKAGELCERFNELQLIRDGKIVKTVPTYRGEGQCFL